jgi:tetratricopeptide (TPR) repeat protein
MHRYLSMGRFPFIALLVSLLTACWTVSVPAVYADNAFADKYRAYQGEVRAAQESFNKKDYQQAIEHYSKAIGISPFEASHYLNRGISRFKTEKCHEAIEDFSNALVLDSRLVQSYGYRALCHEKMGEYLEALKDYTAALAMNPNDASIHNDLAWLYATAKDEKIQDKAKALEHAKKAAELSKEKNAEILDTLARAYFINGQGKEALEAESKALKLDPNNEEFKKDLQLYQKGGANK